MREILFRAKRLNDGEWIEGNYAFMYSCHYIMPKDDYSIWYEVNPDTICQYTGLTDKNGKKIWENDIVYARCKGLSGMGIIKYEDGSLVIKDKKRERTYSLFGEWIFRVDGNIFDNTELLERMG